MNTISVVITTYNGMKYIEKQLLSILHQSVKPNQIVIVDDCSKDDTIYLVKKVIADYNSSLLGKNMDIFFEVIQNKENLGYILNFRKGILHANGDYIFLSDQDDIWVPNKIEKMIATITENNAWLACTGVCLIDKFDKKITDARMISCSPIKGTDNWSGCTQTVSFQSLLWGNHYPGCTYCFTKEARNIYRSIENEMMPHDFQLILIASNEGKAVYLDEPLLLYRIHDTNTIGIEPKKKKYVKHFIPRNLRYIYQLSRIKKVRGLVRISFFLIFRIPKWYSKCMRIIKNHEQGTHDEVKKL